MTNNTELIARLQTLVKELYDSDKTKFWNVVQSIDETVEEAADALQAMERPKQPGDLEQIIDAFVEDYEMLGETEDGRDACHAPTEGERALIKDAICGLLADTDWDNAWGAHIQSLAMERKPEWQPIETKKESHD